MDEDSSSPSGKVNPSRSVWLRVGLGLAFVAAFALFVLGGGTEWLAFDTLRDHREELLAYARSNRTLAILLAVTVYATAVALSLPGGAIMSLAIGFLFGRWLGTVLIIVAATLGATAVFLAARYLFSEAVMRRIGARGRRILSGFEENAFNYLLFLRLVPLFPFWLVNLVPAVAPVRLRTYVLATAIGIIPGSFVFANLGESLGHIDSTDALISTEIIIALALLGLFALVPVGVKRWRKRRAQPPTQ